MTASTLTASKDIAIIGAGPVGLFAVFQCGMLGLRSHVIEALPEIGGQCSALYPEKPIYDIPGHPRLSAAALIENLSVQAAPFAPVYHLRQQAMRLDGTPGDFTLTTDSGTRIQCGAVIIAAGAGAFGPNRPPLPGIAAYEGESVHYMVRDPERFRGKSVAIAGGGDSAVDWALALHGVAKQIHMIHRRDAFRAAPDNVARLRGLHGDGLDLVVPYQLSGLEGEGGKLRAVLVSDLDGNVKRLEAQHLLAFFGLKSDLGALADWGLDIAAYHVPVTPADCASKRPGVYAIGDIASYPGKLKLILSGFAEAAQAAHAAYALLHGQPPHFEYSTAKGLP